MAPAEHSIADGPASTGASFITTPLRDVDGWVAAFNRREIPVLAATADALEDLRSNEDAVDAHLLAECMAADPLMTLKLLRHVAALRRGRDQADAETATEALVMLGITPFFRDFGPQPTVEQALALQSEALLGLRQVLRRAHRAARFALAFAVHRHDHDATLIHEAALAGADNHHLPAVAHVAMVQHPAVWAEACRWLRIDSAGPAARVQ